MLSAPILYFSKEKSTYIHISPQSNFFIKTKRKPAARTRCGSFYSRSFHLSVRLLAFPCGGLASLLAIRTMPIGRMERDLLLGRLHPVTDLAIRFTTIGLAIALRGCGRGGLHHRIDSLHRRTTLALLQHIDERLEALTKDRVGLLLGAHLVKIVHLDKEALTRIRNILSDFVDATPEKSADVRIEQETPLHPNCRRDTSFSDFEDVIHPLRIDHLRAVLDSGLELRDDAIQNLEFLGEDLSAHAILSIEQESAHHMQETVLRRADPAHESTDVHRTLHLGEKTRKSMIVLTYYHYIIKKLNVNINPDPFNEPYEEAFLTF